jgi:transcriptional regulator with XRE-family HTH domain
MKDRIIKFLTSENLTATKFADEIGVQRSSVSHILSGRNNPGFDFIQKILTRYKNVSADWLLLGTGSMYKKTEPVDLFSQPPTPPPKAIQPSLFAAPAEKLSSPETDKINQIIPGLDLSSSHTIERIVIFYADKTFHEYSPAQ